MKVGVHGSPSCLLGILGEVALCSRGNNVPILIDHRRPGGMLSLVRGDSDRVLMGHDGLFIGPAAFLRSCSALHQSQRMHMLHRSLRLA
jgi:hypothetical protein